MGEGMNVPLAGDGSPVSGLRYVFQVLEHADAKGGLFGKVDAYRAFPARYDCFQGPSNGVTRPRVLYHAAAEAGVRGSDCNDILSVSLIAIFCSAPVPSCISHSFFEHRPDSSNRSNLRRRGQVPL